MPRRPVAKVGDVPHLIGEAVERHQADGAVEFGSVRCQAEGERGIGRYRGCGRQGELAIDLDDVSVDRER